MLRLPPTTLSLTMAEVKDFEQRRRFKKYLSKNKTFVNQLPLAPKIVGSPDRVGGGGVGGYSSDLQEADLQNREPQLLHYHQEAVVVPPSPDEKEEKTLKVISRVATEQQSQPGGSVKGSLKSNSNSNSNSNSKSSEIVESTRGGRPTALPPPFSIDTRTVSDTQSLPSVCFN